MEERSQDDQQRQDEESSQQPKDQLEDLEPTEEEGEDVKGGSIRARRS